MGGGGRSKTPRLAAQWAGEFNLPFAPLDAFCAQRDRVRAACETIGRDPASMRFSSALALCCGVDDAEFRRRAAAIGREPDEIGVNGAAGSPEQTAAKIRSFAAEGARRVYLQVLDVTDLEHLDLVAERVVPLL
jgi:alkanesulfonate monooxygenase SsuD/methylene tetrahydromethanopterin reductase-like flavin-dependent oxidoreductase (luciferase family)